MDKQDISKDGLKCWQRVLIVLSSIWVALIWVVMVTNIFAGESTSFGIFLALGIALAPPAVLYGFGFLISSLACRIRKTVR